MPPPLLALLACAGLFQVDGALLNHTARSVKALDTSEGGCLYEGRWHAEGAVVRTREACLSCACARGALWCRRRACAALPDPPPRRCHVLHRKGSCCPELHCPDGVKLMELGASTRFEDEDYSDISSPTSVGHACVEGGAVFGAGSALAARAACEQCFCLGGARRCVRPRCLPPPPGCAARPAPGACCPQRYYCDHATPPPAPHGSHDCEVEGSWFAEGERVAAVERRGGCAHCFCLRGRVRCQPLACAPPLLGCTPLLRAGECCPHQYRCEHAEKLHEPHNSLISVRNEDRSLHKSDKKESTTKPHDTPTKPPTKKMPATTTKVKRKTNETPHSDTKQKPVQNSTSTSTKPTSPQSEASTTDRVVRSNFDTSTTEDLPETTSTEQPEGTVRIVINGTINCTAELSSTSLPLNLTTNDTERIKMEVHPRIPIINTASIESHTFNPNDIITDRSVLGDFDESEVFTVNVTSSLSTNSSRVTPGSIASKTPVPTDLPAVLNMSKKTNDFDFDYAEPTLPPSLPNLKIIPFVAADAVLDDDEPPKEVLTYPILEREDKYPVYYPTLESKVTPLASRRKDVYQPTQYPVFMSEKVDTSQYPVLSHEVDITSSDYPAAKNDLLHEHTASTAVDYHESDKAVTNTPATGTTFRLETPSVNLFSPPAETEGGFIPKGPGIIGEYYAVYPSTPSGPSVPHLTTSMQLDTVKECISSDGHRVLEGESISLACSVCSCAWGEMHCAPRPCPAPAGCRRRPAASAADVCCGELVCDQVTEKGTTSTSTTTTEKPNEISNETKVHDSKVYDSNAKTESNLSKNEAKENNTTNIEENLSEQNVTQSASSNNGSHSKDNVTTSIAKILSTSSSTSSTTTTTTSSTTIITTTAPDHKKINLTTSDTPDYEEDEEEDEGFSFGSVLKLLLSDSYDSTTTPPHKKKTTAAPSRPPPIKMTTNPPSTSTRKPAPMPSLAQFVPMPHYPYAPPKKTFQQNTVNRIDHLVLGEATAIKKTTPRPTVTPFRPVATTPRPLTTRRVLYTTRTTTRREELITERTSASPEENRPPVSNASPGVGGLLKLAGCNIYGRMYRVGRIIAELSTPCHECRCTELGVQCRPLPC